MDRRAAKQPRVVSSADGKESGIHNPEDEHAQAATSVWSHDLPRELLQAISRHVPPHQRGAMRLVCRIWCEAISQDVVQLQLPLAVLAGPPAWQIGLLGPAAAAPREAALRDLFTRFPHANHLVLLHNTVLPPPTVQAALSSVRSLCPAMRHVELRDSVSWEQPAELAPLVMAGSPAPVPGSSGGSSSSRWAGPAGPSPTVVRASAAAAEGASEGAVGLRELTVTYLASPDMQRVARRWFSRELERMVTPDWSLERLRVRWLMGEAPRAFFLSRGFTRWTNAMTEVAPDRLGRVQFLEFAWAELSDVSFDRPLAAGAQAAHATALAPPLPPWLPEPYHAALPPPPPAPGQPPDAINPAAAAMAMLAGAPGTDADSVFQAAMDGQMAEEEAGILGRGLGQGDRWNQMGTLEDSATAALGLRGVGSGALAAGASVAAAKGLRPGLPLALCAFTNLKTLSLCCMASQAPADHLLRLLLRCRRIEKLSLVHHEAYASWPVRRVQPNLMQMLEQVVREELGTVASSTHHAAGGAAATSTAATTPVGPDPAVNTPPSSSVPSRHHHPHAPNSAAGASATPNPPGSIAAAVAAGGRAPWWPSDLVLRLRELQLPATPALLALLHLPHPALSNLELLDLQVIMAQGFGGPLGGGDQALAGTARLVSALKAVRASGARLRDLYLNNVDLSPNLLEAISQIDSLEQVLVFSGVLIRKDRDREPGSSDDDDHDLDDDVDGEAEGDGDGSDSSSGGIDDGDDDDDLDGNVNINDDVENHEDMDGLDSMYSSEYDPEDRGDPRVLDPSGIANTAGISHDEAVNFAAAVTEALLSGGGAGPAGAGRGRGRGSGAAEPLDAGGIEGGGGIADATVGDDLAAERLTAAAEMAADLFDITAAIAGVGAGPGGGNPGGGGGRQGAGGIGGGGGAPREPPTPAGPYGGSLCRDKQEERPIAAGSYAPSARTPASGAAASVATTSAAAAAGESRPVLMAEDDGTQALHSSAAAAAAETVAAAAATRTASLNARTTTSKRWTALMLRRWLEAGLEAAAGPAAASKNPGDGAADGAGGSGDGSGVGANRPGGAFVLEQRLYADVKGASEEVIAAANTRGSSAGPEAISLDAANHLKRPLAAAVEATLVAVAARATAAAQTGPKGRRGSAPATAAGGGGDGGGNSDDDEYAGGGGDDGGGDGQGRFSDGDGGNGGGGGRRSATGADPEDVVQCPLERNLRIRQVRSQRRCEEGQGREQGPGSSQLDGAGDMVWSPCPPPRTSGSTPVCANVVDGDLELQKGTALGTSTAGGEGAAAATMAAADPLSGEAATAAAAAAVDAAGAGAGGGSAAAFPVADGSGLAAATATRATMVVTDAAARTLADITWSPSGKLAASVAMYLRALACFVGAVATLQGRYRPPHQLQQQQQQQGQQEQQQQHGQQFPEGPRTMTSAGPTEDGVGGGSHAGNGGSSGGGSGGGAVAGAGASGGPPGSAAAEGGMARLDPLAVKRFVEALVFLDLLTSGASRGIMQRGLEEMAAVDAASVATDAGKITIGASASGSSAAASGATGANAIADAATQMFESQAGAAAVYGTMSAAVSATAAAVAATAAYDTAAAASCAAAGRIYGGLMARLHDKVRRAGGGTAAVAAAGGGASGRASPHEVGLFLLLSSAVHSCSGALRRQLARLEQEGAPAALHALRSGGLRGTLQEGEVVAALLGWAQAAETLGAMALAAEVAARLAEASQAPAAAEQQEPVGGSSSAAAPSSSATGEAAAGPPCSSAAEAAAAATDPEAVMEALLSARPAGQLRRAADEGLLSMLRLDGLTRLTRLRRLCLDLSPDNAVALPVASAVRVFLRNLPSLESLHVTDQYAHPDKQPMGSLALPTAATAADGRGDECCSTLYDMFCNDNSNSSHLDVAASANKLTSLTLAARPPRRAWRVYTADASGALLAPAPNGNDAVAAAAPNLVALLVPLDRTELSGALCERDMQAHWRMIPRNLRALCLHRVRMLDLPEGGKASFAAATAAAAEKHLPTQPQGAQVAAASGQNDATLAALPPPRRRSPAVPPLLQHMWLSNVTFTAPMDFAGLMRELLAAVPVSGGLQTLVVRHCFVVRRQVQAATDGAAAAATAAATVTAIRLMSSALSTMASVGNGASSSGARRRQQPQQQPQQQPWQQHVPIALHRGGGGRGWPAFGELVASAATHASVAQAQVALATGGGRTPQRLVLNEEEAALLCDMQSLRMLGLDSCLRMEDVGRLAALTALRTLAINPNVVASEEARARLEMEMASRFSTSLQAALMRLAPLTGLRGLWLPEWAANRSQLLLWQSQLAALGPALVTLRVMDHDNLWRLPTPAGCPDVEDSLQWWQAGVWNTI